MLPALVADENISGITIRLLRARGLDVLSVGEMHPSLRDEEVLELARARQRWLVTFDRDYGDLIFNRHLPPPPGIVYLHFLPRTPEEPAGRILEALEKFAGTAAFVVVGRRTGMRMRPLPGHGG